MNKKSIWIWMLLYSFLSIHAQKAVCTHISQLEKLNDEYTLYALPLTKLLVNIEAVHTQFIPGPYSNYCERLLGIRPIATSGYEKWSVSKAQLEECTLADPQQYFAFTGFPVYVSNDMEQLASRHLIILPEKKTGTCAFKNEKKYEPNHVSPFFSEVSLGEMEYERLDSIIYKQLIRDSIRISIPEHKKTMVHKTPEENAREMAQRIFELRQMKIDVLSGEFGLADGDGISHFIREIEKLEKYYVSLFTGIELVEHYNHVYEFEPKAKKHSEDILAKFSEFTGFLDINDFKGKSIIIEISSSESLNELAKVSKSPPYSSETGLFYRVPESAIVTIKMDNQMYLQQSCTIYQQGVVLVSPVKNKKISF